MAVPPTVQTRDKVVAFEPVVVGFPFTVTVQVPAAARSATRQLSAVMVKFVVSAIVGAAHVVAAAAPEFVSVKTWVAESVPTVTLPKSFVSGLHASVAATPVTTTWFAVVVTVPPTVQARERVVVFKPVEAGFPWTETVHVALLPAKSVVEQVSDRIVKFVESVIVGAVQDVAEPVPEFVSVNVCAVEALPMYTLPKSFVRGDHASEACTPVAVS